MATYGSGWGAHALCNLTSFVPPGAPCTLISAGIGHDASFDGELSDRHGCAGVGLDPSVQPRAPATSSS